MPTGKADQNAGGGRVVRDVVDGGGSYFSRVATAGPFAFMAGVAVDDRGELAQEARVDPPYAVSPPAHVVAQTRYLFDRYCEALTAVGSDINQVVQVEQFIPAKRYADGYLDTSRGPGYMERGRPSSALLATGDLAPDGCVINPSGIAVVSGAGIDKEIVPSSPGYQEALRRGEYGDTYAEEGPFNEVVTGGGYVFTVGDMAFDWTTREVEAGAYTPPSIWWGSEIRNEAEFLLDRFATYLDRVGATLDDVVHTTVYLTDVRDLYELDRVWRRRFQTAPPARTVIPIRGLGAPRFEGFELDHRHGAPKMEHLSQSIRPGHGLQREVVDTGRPRLLHESEAIKAGPLLWISGQYAIDERGSATSDGTERQLDQIFERLDAICAAGGTALSELVRLRAFVTDVADAPLVAATLKQAVPLDPPTVVVSGVPGPLPFPGASVVVDAVAHVPES